MTRTSIGEPVQRPTQRQAVQRPFAGSWTAADDVVAREEPLEVIVRANGQERRLGLLLRTPGHDQELALGLLFAEGIIDGADEVRRVVLVPSDDESQEFNSVRVEIEPTRPIDWERIARPLVMTAACGVCGRAMLSGLHEHARPASRDKFAIRREVLLGLPDVLRREQDVFDRTGGIHAAGLFDAAGNLELLREDVGRHNAVDKLVGRLLRERRLPAEDRLLLVSGRAGYEVVQKAVRAGVPFVASVGAPSSLAVEAAQEFETTLVGFLREGRFNAYCGSQRVVP